jgi:hypothetical protein
MKDTLLIFLYSMVTAVFGLILYSKYKTMITSKKELNHKLEHNRRFIEKNSQFDEDKLNFFKT